VIASTTTIEIEEAILEEHLTITEEVVLIITKIKKGAIKMIFLKVQLNQEITGGEMITVVIMSTKINGSKKILRKK
jgi:hypothetical protein